MSTRNVNHFIENGAQAARTLKIQNINITFFSTSMYVSYHPVEKNTDSHMKNRLGCDWTCQAPTQPIKTQSNFQRTSPNL